MRRLLLLAAALVLLAGSARAQTPAKDLYVAVLKDKPAEVAALLTGPADANATVELVPGFPTTYLIIAAGHNHLAVAKLLLQHKALINKADSFQSTALMAAAAKGYAEMVALLLASGADPNAKDEDGKTALALAQAGNHAAVVALLSKKA